MIKKINIINVFCMSVICFGIFAYIDIAKYLINGVTTKNFIQNSPFALNAGEKESLPEEVLLAKKIILRNSIDYFLLDKHFLDDVYLYQRMIEFSYPAKLGKSPFFIGLKNGDLKKSCDLIDTEKNISAYVCK